MEFKRGCIWAFTLIMAVGCRGIVELMVKVRPAVKLCVWASLIRTDVKNGQFADFLKTSPLATMAEKLLSEEFFEAGEIPVCVFRMPYSGMSRGIHSHDFHEIMIVVAGLATHCLGGTERLLTVGDVFVIPPDLEHGYTVRENSGVEVLNVLFNLEKLRMDLRDLDQVPGFQALFSLKQPARFEPHLKLNVKDLAYLHSICETIEEEQESMAPGCEFACQTKLRELILFLSRRFSYQATPSGLNMNMVRIGEIVSFMERNLGEELRFERLVEKSHMSPTTLRRAFQDAFGCSPMAYLQKLRIRKAMLLLANPIWSIIDIAFAVGFNDSGYFSRVFKQETGESPKKFRARV